ncbi:hypothetical protein TRIP_B200393 [uncultured Desulfatiglans sp.]|nr:hypothetical protein TRIP_B200393 [uncultured Desulfatiglans sp.]
MTPFCRYVLSYMVLDYSFLKTNRARPDTISGIVTFPETEPHRPGNPPRHHPLSPGNASSYQPFRSY